MTATVVELFDAARSLADGDRAALAGLLLESLDVPADSGVDAAWAQEIERRVREIDAGSVQSIPWETLKTRLLARR